MSLAERIDRLIDDQCLPPAFALTVQRFYRPLAARIHRWREQVDGPLLVGISGAQGTGKSTLAAFLRLLLEHQHGRATAVLSLDDFYLTRDQRQRLARRIHPLLAVRGVPGTHDTALALDCFDRLAIANAMSSTALPSFDKAADEPKPFSDWPRYSGRPDILLFEGWCVGARPQSEAALAQPVNDLEAREDPGGRWRQYVNQRLADDYRQLFDRLDRLVMLQVPDWKSVYLWRLEQEEKLREHRIRQGADTSGLMRPAEVERFVQYYERLTRHMLAEMPSRADAVLALDDQHRVARLSGPNLEFPSSSDNRE